MFCWKKIVSNGNIVYYIIDLQKISCICFSILIRQLSFFHLHTRVSFVYVSISFHSCSSCFCVLFSYVLLFCKFVVYAYNNYHNILSY